MPAAEPDFELLSCNSSGDERDAGQEMDGYESVPKVYKHLIRTELKRGGARSPSPSNKQMPPELIITPAQQGKSASTDESGLIDAILGPLENKDKTNVISELPPITLNNSGTSKRNHIWHHFKKCVPTIRFSLFSFTTK